LALREGVDQGQAAIGKLQVDEFSIEQTRFQIDKLPTVFFEMDVRLPCRFEQTNHRKLCDLRLLDSKPVSIESRNLHCRLPGALLEKRFDLRFQVLTGARQAAE